ncbi:hypothetical protein PENTCL1PPCAC_10223, partial [Pristionchus entomophagus]
LQNEYWTQSAFADQQVSVGQGHAEWRRHPSASPVTVPLQASPNELDYDTPHPLIDNCKAWEKVTGFEYDPALSPGYDLYPETSMLGISPATPTTPANHPLDRGVTAYYAQVHHHDISPICVDRIPEPSLGNCGPISPLSTHHGRPIRGTISSPFESLRTNVGNAPPRLDSLTGRMSNAMASPSSPSGRCETRRLGQPGHSAAQATFTGPHADASYAFPFPSGKKAPSNVAAKRKAQPALKESRGYKRKTAEQIAEIENYEEKRFANNIAVKICRAEEKARTKAILERLVYLEELIKRQRVTNLDRDTIAALLEECGVGEVVLNDKERKKIGLPPNY